MISYYEFKLVLYVIFPLEINKICRFNKWLAEFKDIAARLVAYSNVQYT